MYHDMLTNEILIDQRRYKIEDMVKAIFRRYPDMYNGYAFQNTRDFVIDYTMSMDRNEQRDEMVRLMCKVISEDRKAKKDNDSCGRWIAARLFLVAVDLHPYYRNYISNFNKN